MRRSKRVLKRIESNLKKFKQLFATAVQNDLNEADTRVMILDFLQEVMGYDKFAEITAEFMVRGEYIDLAVKLDGEVMILIEIKSAQTELKESHLRQITSYAANKGTEWAVLTNGPIWQVYHIAFEKPIDVKLVFEVDILNEKYETRTLNLLYLLTKESMVNKSLSDYWGQTSVLTPANILRVLFSSAVLKRIRQQLFYATKTKVALDDINKVLVDDILKKEITDIPKPFERRPRKKKSTEESSDKPSGVTTGLSPVTK